MADKRRAPRVVVNLPARWEGVLGGREGTITSLSTCGCFVLSGGELEPGELIRMEIDLPEQETVYCWGEVTDRAFDIGFAVSFTAVEEAEQERLAEFISLLLEDQ
jgi:hypothetical protein